MNQTARLLGFMCKPTIGARRHTSKLFALVVLVFLAQLVILPLATAGTVTWDASGANAAAPTDGLGNWDISTANWSDGSTDNGWVNGNNAVIGANNGAAGTITITTAAGVIVSNLTFNAAGSGIYNIGSSGGALILTNNPTITIANNVVATNSAQLGGSGFTKAGNGTFVLKPSVAATNVGVTTVNAGTLFMASTTVNSLNDNVVVNSGGTLLVPSSLGMNPTKTLTINGGTVTNMGLNGTSTETHTLVVFDNGGILAYGPAASGQLNATNLDFRSGFQVFPKMTMTTNFSVKSTPGTMDFIGRPSSTGPQGLILTVLGGTMFLDYPLVAPNNDSTQGGAKLQQQSPLTLGGGKLLGIFNSTASRSEKPAGTIIWPGATSFCLTNNAGNYTFVLGALSRNVGGTIDYGSGGSLVAPAISTTSGNVNDIQGGWATWAGSDWAVGLTITNYSAYTTTTTPATWAAANNVSLGASTVEVGDGVSINSLRLTGNATVALDGNFTLASGGLLIIGSAAPTINGAGALLGGSGADLIVQQYSSGDLTIASVLTNNGTATSLTKSGPGKLIITGTDYLTGNNYLNRGTVEVSDLAKLASGSLVMNNGTLRYTGSSDANSTRSVVLAGVGGTFDIQGSVKVTQTTPIVSAGGATAVIFGNVYNLGDWSGLTKVGSGTLVLAANNVYNGPTVVSNGLLSVNGINSLTGTSGPTNYTGGGVFTVYGGTLGGVGTIPGLVTVKNGGTISPGNSIGTLTLASGLTLESGSTSLFEESNSVAGDLLQVQGDLTIQPNSTIAISILGAALEPVTNTLITYTGTKTGSFNPTVIVNGSLNSSVSIDESTPGQINLVAVANVALTCQPQDAIVSTNDPVCFNVCATGSAPISYQWYFTPDLNTTPVAISGATNSSYCIAHADGTNNGFYYVVVSNSYNSVTSASALLTVGYRCPLINGLSDQTVIQGSNVTFSANVIIANPYPTFQWQTNFVNVDGATNSSLTLTNVQYNALNNATISLIASNAACIVTNSATLTVIVPPVITCPLTNITVNVGDTAVFHSCATGIPGPGLQWYKNGSPISGQTNDTLTITNAQGSDIGIYTIMATNTAGAVTNSGNLTVISTTLAQQGSLSPANNATGICYDTPLYVTFNGPVYVVKSGKIRVYNAANPATPVDVINMSSNTVFVVNLSGRVAGPFLTNNFQPHSLFPGDSQVINYFPVIISGNTAVIYPHGGVLTSNQTYYVTMDNGIVADTSGAYFAGISDTNAWRFTTKVGGPVNPTNIIVSADGTKDFLTVQGAVDSVPPGNTSYTVINVRDGTYTEIVNISGKNNVTFRGQSRAGTVIGYANNNNVTGTTGARMAFKVNASDIVIENLTLVNTTPQGGSQAEALLIYNNGLRCIVNSCDINSRQDTILINANTSAAYFYNCKIVGNFDYIWGVGVGYLDHCVLHTITNIYSSSYNLTAARTLTSTTLSATTPWINPNGTTYSANGFSFVHCTLEAEPGLTNISLAGSNGTVGGLDAWIYCCINTNAYVCPAAQLLSQYVYWQCTNYDITCSNIITFPCIQTIGVTNNDPRLVAATSPTVWFSGWTPQSAPNIVSQPANQNVSAGQSASFIVDATGIPDPAYQWYKNGVLISGATAANYSIASAVPTNAGDYTVVASNSSGSVTSIVATLTYNNTAPVANPSTYSRPAGYPLNILITGNLSTYWSDADGDPLGLAGGISSTNGASVSYDSTYVHYTNANNVADQINYTVSDTFTTTPGVITVIVTPPPTNSVAGTVVNGNGSVTLSFVGVPNYTYQVEATLDLTPPAVWLPVSTNTADIINGTWQFTDTQATNYIQRFYRSVYRP